MKKFLKGFFIGIITLIFVMLFSSNTVLAKHVSLIQLGDDIYTEVTDINDITDDYYIITNSDATVATGNNTQGGFNGCKIINEVIDESTFKAQPINITHYEGKLKFKVGKYTLGYDYLGYLELIEFPSGFNIHFEFYYENTILKLKTANGFFITYSSSSNRFDIQKNGEGDSLRLFKLNDDPFASHPFTEIQTKASLKVKYNTETKEPLDVDLRFGGIIPYNVYEKENEYGVIVLPKLDEHKLNNLSLGGLNILKQAGYVQVAEPAQVKGGFQYAWVITNMENNYATELVATMYTIRNGRVILAKPISDFVLSVRDKTLDVITDPDIIEVLNNIKFN